MATNPLSCQFVQVLGGEARTEFSVNIAPMVEKILPRVLAEPITPYNATLFKHQEDFEFVTISLLYGTVRDTLRVAFYVQRNGIVCFRIEHIKKSGAYKAISCEIDNVNPNSLSSQTPRFFQDVCKVGWTKATFVFDEVVVKIILRETDLENELFEPDRDRASTVYPRTFEKYLDSSEFSDIEILANGNIFRAHRIFLADRSPVFSRMLKYTDAKIDLTDISGRVMKELLQFVYTNTTDCLRDNDLSLLIQLFLTADRFFMEDLKGLCIKAILPKITEEFALELWHMAIHFQLQKLQIVLKQFCRTMAHLVFVDGSPLQDLAKLCFPHLTCEANTQCSFCHQ